MALTPINLWETALRLLSLLYMVVGVSSGSALAIHLRYGQSIAEVRERGQLVTHLMFLGQDLVISIVCLLIAYSFWWRRSWGRHLAIGSHLLVAIYVGRIIPLAFIDPNEQPNLFGWLVVLGFLSFVVGIIVLCMRKEVKQLMVT